MSPRPAPRPRGILLRLMVLVTAAALAVFMQAGAGASSGPHAHGPEQSAPAEPQAGPEECASPANATPTLNHPGLAQAAQPRADASRRPSSDCSREASAGS